MKAYSGVMPPCALRTFKAVLAQNNKPSEYDELLELWVYYRFPDGTHRKALWELLHEIGAVVNYKHCGKWFNDFSFGYMDKGVIRENLYGNLSFEETVRITKLGKQFIEKLFDNYIKPNL
jgi:hypothetical protein